VFDDVAKVDDNTFYRDLAVHFYLESIARKHRLTRQDLALIAPSNVYFSNEFFKDASKEDLENAIKHIRDSYERNENLYHFYNFNTDKRIQKEESWPRTENNTLRNNQKEAIKRFNQAVENGRKNLLMYAVMRFGKTFTSLCCANEMNAKLVVVVSGKADVKTEWKKEVEQQKRFEGYYFIDSKKLKTGFSINEELKDKRLVVFLTLQDLQGNDIKEHHEELFDNQNNIDLLIIDETHFAARANEYGKILQSYNLKGVDEDKTDKTAEESLDVLDKHIKALNAKVRLHLSGTPYRILMSSEFDRDKDIISFVQSTDIIEEKEKWIKQNQAKKEDLQQEEWENPYFGFPQMVRFALNPNDSAREKLQKMGKNGISAKLSELFKPRCLDYKEGYDSFIHEQEVLDLLQAIDGSKEDQSVFPFLDYDKIKRGKMCRHMVFVLPWRASCDAMEKLLKRNIAKFKNLSEYEILNISGLHRKRELIHINQIKSYITACENTECKTITLTVNKMLTGCTVPEWDTMVYLKDSVSPQEYDQSTFRIQSPYIRQYVSDEGKIMKQDMKPQTLLVDFSPERMFILEQQKAFIFNSSKKIKGKENLEKRLQKELEISPVILFNKDKIKQVTPSDIIDAIRSYNKDKSVIEEANDISIDFSLINNDIIKNVIEQYNEIDAKNGIHVKPFDSEEDDLDIHPQPTKQHTSKVDDKGALDSKGNELNKFEKKFRSFYANILYFAFLSKDRNINTLQQIIDATGKDNERIFKHLHLEKDTLIEFAEAAAPQVIQSLDFKISNIQQLTNDISLTPLERAINAMKKFGRMSKLEIVTPENIADIMVAQLPDEAKNWKILDIASKQGEFAIAIWKRFGKTATKNIFAIPTSPLAYEFTKKIFDILEIPISNLCDNYYAYNLINGIEKEEITETLKTMNFNVVIGNPPYQDFIHQAGDRPNPIYHRFMDIAYSISPKAILIHPARFLFDAGQTPSYWNKKMLNDQHLKVLFYEQQGDKVFNNVELKGGVAITLRDTQKNFGAIEIFSPYEELHSIALKVKAKKEQHIGTIIAAQGLYRFSDLFFNEHPEAVKVIGKGTGNKIVSSVIDKLPEVFKDKKDDDCQYVRFLGRIKVKNNYDREYKYIARKYLEENEYIDTYNLFLPEANNTGSFGETLTDATLGLPCDGASDTYLSAGKFKTSEEALNLEKYVKTKFFRALLGIKKVTQHCPSKVWETIPLQDFSSNSDINWKESISEIDRQLYTKYGLTDKECSFIERMVKPMDI